jgi:hypothetical protein
MNIILRHFSLAGIIFSLLLFSSCTKKNQAEINRIDSLMAVMDSSAIKFMTIDTVRIKNIIDSSKHKVKLIREYAPDSLDKQTTILLVDFMQLYEALENFSVDRKNIFPQITFSGKQLENMKYDLSNNAMNEKEFKENFPQEQRAVGELYSAMNMHSYKTSLLIAQYDNMRTRVDSFVTQLDTTRGNKKKNPNLNRESYGEED